jgi:hypothetical protein
VKNALYPFQVSFEQLSDIPDRSQREQVAIRDQPVFGLHDQPVSLSFSPPFQFFALYLRFFSSGDKKLLLHLRSNCTIMHHMV